MRSLVKKSVINGTGIADYDPAGAVLIITEVLTSDRIPLVPWLLLHIA
jgi:hypothetical protein